MKKNLIQLSLAVALGAMLVACEPKPEPSQQEGTVDNVQCVRTELLTHQPTVFTATYKPSKDYDAKNAIFYLSITQDGKEGDYLEEKETVTYEGGTLTAKVKGFKEGSFQVKVVALEESKVDVNHKYIESAPITVNVTNRKADVRNSLWSSKKDMCLLDISYYINEQPRVSANGDTIEFAEPDGYYEKWDHVARRDFNNDRTVQYVMAENGSIEFVRYFLQKEKGGFIYLCAQDFNDHVNFMANSEYYGNPTFKLSYSASTTVNVTATEAEKALAEEYITNPAGFTKFEELSAAVKKGAIGLMAECEKTGIDIIMDYDRGYNKKGYTINFQKAIK